MNAQGSRVLVGLTVVNFFTRYHAQFLRYRMYSCEVITFMVTRSSATAESTARPSCLDGLLDKSSDLNDRHLVIRALYKAYHRLLN